MTSKFDHDFNFAEDNIKNTIPMTTAKSISRFIVDERAHFHFTLFNPIILNQNRDIVQNNKKNKPIHVIKPINVQRTNL